MNTSGCNDVNDAAPKALNEIVGQERAIEALKMYLSAYHNDRTAGKHSSFGPVCFSGPPGTGKTLIARSLHNELKKKTVIETIGENLDKKSELYPLFLGADDETTIFIDEAQGMSSRAQNILLKVLAEGKLCVPKGRFSNDTHHIPLARFVTIIATTHEHMLQAALRSRMRVHCRFEHYGIDDLVTITKQRADALRWEYESDDMLQMIAVRSKKNPRQALRHLQMCWNVARSHNTDVITLEHARQAFDLSEIDELGLDHLEREYLRLLTVSSPLRLNVLAARLELPSRTIQDVVEPYLMQEGLIEKEAAGRLVTAKGRDHIMRMSYRANDA